MADLNSNIPMMGNSVNILAQYSDGYNLGRQRAFHNMLRQNGAGIVQGDQQALNALAGFSPETAQSMQLARTQEARAVQAHDLDMRAKSEGLRIRLAQEKRAILEQAASMDKAQREEAAAKLEAAVRMGLSAQTPEQWDALMQQRAPEYVGMFGAREMLANEFISTADALKNMQGPEPKTQLHENQVVTINPDGTASASPIANLQQPGPEWRAATPEEAAQYGAQAGQFNTKTGQFVKTPLDKGMRVVSDGNGGFTFEQGPGVTGTGDTSVGDVYNPAEVQDTLTLIDAISEDANLGRVLGPVQGGGGNDVEQLNAVQRAYYGSGGLNVIEKMNQLQSRTWLAARAMLKGGGPITDYESRKAEAAVARLSRTKDIKEYQAALKELRDAITEGMAKLEAAKRGKNVPQIGAGLPNFGNMTDDQLDAWISENSQ